MKKAYGFACSLLFVIFSATLVPALTCNPITVTGSYVRQITVPFSPNPYIEQLTLGVDGRAYWFSSLAFDLIMDGTFIPQVGSWTCLPDGSVLVTTIGADYLQNSPFFDVPQPNQPFDINIFQNTRITEKLSVVDQNTLRSTQRVTTLIPLANDPLGPGQTSSCSPSGTPCQPSPYRRIRPLVTDLQ